MKLWLISTLYRSFELLVMKFYGLETLFPATWGDDNTAQIYEPQKTAEETEAASKAVTLEEDTSDPLKIKGKIKYADVFFASLDTADLQTIQQAPQMDEI